ncbi:hypothetical protein GEMRC1_007317 [Eukaryota sp. GEM-RC1]
MTITDPRFAHVHADPKFKSVKNKKNKVKIDKRFADAMKDEDYTTVTSVDSYGRPVMNEKFDDLKKYYDMSDPEEDAAVADPTKYGFGESSDEESDMENFDATDVLSNQTTEPLQEDLDDLQPSTVPTLSEGEETNRLAVCHLDWNAVSAVDLLSLARSFASQPSLVTSVTIYVSDYGMERLAAEEVHGPELDDLDEIKEDMGEEVNNDEEAMQEAIRRYEISKMRYYFAVIECEDVPTALVLYSEMDRSTIGQTGNTIDLRFIPGEVSFEGRMVRDAAADVPVKYIPTESVSTPLEQTNIKISWDSEDIPSRMILHKKVSKAEVEEADYDDLVADTSEEEEEFDGKDLAFEIEYDIVPTREVEK